MSERIEVRIGPSFWPDGTQLTPHEEEAVKARVGEALNGIFYESEIAQKILGPLIHSWCTEGEPCPDDLGEIMEVVRDLWGLMLVRTDRAQQLARVAELERLIRAGFERRREAER